LLSHGTFAHGFTLLEMCMVLVIIALLFAVTMPAMQSAFVEQAVRKDAHQLALMVKTGMIQSAEQHRAYVIELTSTTMSLHPVDETQKDDLDSTFAAAPADDDTVPNSATEDIDVASRLDPPNQLLVADTVKKDAWVALEPTSWVFQPGELCPACRVRLSRGDSYVEMSFNALTGDVENEATYLP
jgi:prepilin-type N-terminal cleavage/methylation domain-containing protein